MFLDDMLLFYGLLLCLLVAQTLGEVKPTINCGTILFHNKRNNLSECWTGEELALLRTRKAFDSVIPSCGTPDRCNDKYVRYLIKFCKTSLAVSERSYNPSANKVIRQALADALGSHLQCDILPTVRYSFYAGYIPYKKAKRMHDFQEKLKRELNTQGIGWRKPDKLPKWSNITVARLQFNAVKLFDPCKALVLKRDVNSCIHLPTPLMDDLNTPHAIALPFKKGGLYSLESDKSNNILVNYYSKAVRCILHSSPPKCKHKDLMSFNKGIWRWMKREVAPRLADEKLYAAFGGVLRIAATVQKYRKSPHRRNLFSTPDPFKSKWHPWKVNPDVYCSYQDIAYDWTPLIYASIAAFVALCVLQCIWCRGRCKGKSTPRKPTCPPPMSQKTIFHANAPTTPKTPEKSQMRSSGASVHTTKVYDLNENTEKMMAIIMSENDSYSDECSSYKKIKCTEKEADLRSKKSPRRMSPPKLDTSISQLRIDKIPMTSNPTTKTAVYSTSSLTRSDLTFVEQPVTDSMWSGSMSGSGSESSTITHSGSSSASQTRSTRRSKSSRDVAWAKRVLSKQTDRNSYTDRNVMTTSVTPYDMDSYTTSTITPETRSRKN